jgi:glycosyltransferase involved in cell wall biosynthesis
LSDTLNGKKILFLVTEAGYFLSHRLALAKALQQQGAFVAVITASLADSIEGISTIHFSWKRKGMNPLQEGLALLRLMRLLHREKPDYLLNIALKPVLYGSIAALFLPETRCVNFITGLGYLFTENTWKTLSFRKILLMALRFLLRSTCVITQNTDDYALFQSLPHLFLILGSGVDCTRFKPSPEHDGICTVILPARMLWHKGVKEFAEAARLLKAEGVEARFWLVGSVDTQNPAAIPIETLRSWTQLGNVVWKNEQEDMASVFSAAHIVCLPSYYREGIPKALLEAAACGRPIVTTDSVGCREVVHHQENGLLVPPRTVYPLANALRQLIRNPELRQKMGRRGRERAEREFVQEKICAETIDVISSFSQGTSSSSAL